MSVKAEVHELVDHLDDRRAGVALAYLRRLLMDDATATVSVTTPGDPPTGPPLVAGRDFLTQRSRAWQELAEEQGVGAIADFEEILGDGDVGSDDETVDEMIATIRAWRHEGGYA